jgi:serine/threonine protein phosphatase PrpC
VPITTVAATDPGRARPINEDALLVDHALGLVVVADGMGGHQRGDVASRLACAVLRESIGAERGVLEAYHRRPEEPLALAVLDLLHRAVAAANEEIWLAGAALTGEGGRMGTTLDALLTVGPTGFLAHVGDGRVYLQRGGVVHQITEDHSLVQQQLREGTIDREEARRARFRNVITRALGVFPTVQPDTFRVELQPGDRLLLCSDGLHRYIGQRELGFTLAAPVSADTATRLVGLANERGGRDNITVAVCSVPAAEERAPPPVAATVDALRRTDLFQFCTRAALVRLAALATPVSLPEGSLVFVEGELGRELFILVSGRVAIDKGDTRLAVLGPGDSFGEMSFLDEPARSATATTVEAATLLSFDRDTFLLAVQDDVTMGATVLWQLLLKLSRRLRASNDLAVAGTLSLDGAEWEDGATEEEDLPPPRPR